MLDESCAAKARLEAEPMPSAKAQIRTMCNGATLSFTEPLHPRIQRRTIFMEGLMQKCPRLKLQRMEGVGVEGSNIVGGPVCFHRQRRSETENKLIKEAGTESRVILIFLTNITNIFNNLSVPHFSFLHR